MIIAYVTTSGEPVIRIALDPSADSYCNLIRKLQECSLAKLAYFLLISAKCWLLLRSPTQFW